MTTILNIIFNIIAKKYTEKEEFVEDPQKMDSNLTATVKKTINTFNELNVDILKKEKMNFITEPGKTREDLEIMNVLNSIDRMVSDQGNREENTSKSKKEPTLNERISPLEEFNALFRNVDGVRKSLKLKDSGIV